MSSAFDKLNKVGFTAPKKLSRFDLSFSNSLSQNGGEVMPFLCKEIIAGDSFELTTSHVTRMITPAVPVMDNLVKDDFYFFIPMRLCSKDPKDWEAIFGTDKGLLTTNEQTALSTGNALPAHFTGAGNLVYDVTATDINLFPQLKYGALAALGYPLLDRATNNNSGTINLFKANAYIKVWNDWFRDEFLQEEIPLANTSVLNTQSYFEFWQVLNPKTTGSLDPVGCLYANRLHDYFTSCLISPQNGNAVMMPLVGSAPVITSNTENTFGTGIKPGIKMRESSNDQLATAVTLGTDSFGYTNITATAGDSSGMTLYPTNLIADLSQVTGATITALRQAFAIQAILERDMLGGHKRYNEVLQAHFNTSPNDQTLQRSQYLGSMRSMLSVSQVIQSAPTNSSPLGTTGAFSNTSNSSFIGKFSFNEPGYLMGVSVIRPMNTFANSVDKTIYRNRRFDWYWPLLANLSEQPVKLIELDPSASDSTILGYQEAWQDYRVGRNELHGAFLYDTLIKQWTFADFTANTDLSDVIGYKDTISQTLVATGQPYQFITNYYFDVKANRPLPMFSIPARIGGYF